MPKKVNMKKETEYPDEILHIKNLEKTYHESWYKGRNKLNFPHPFRMLLLGGVNMGKTNITKNVILRANPPFKKIYLLHVGGDYTLEYDDIQTETLEAIPKPDDDIFDPKVKKLFIIEDKEYKFMSKKELQNLDRLFGYVSTHRNTSIISTGQYFYNMPVPIRNMSNIFVIWRPLDLDSLNSIGRRIGLRKEEILSIMDRYFKKSRDSLWVDLTTNSPYKLRLNGFKVLQKKDSDKIKNVNKDYDIKELNENKK